MGHAVTSSADPVAIIGAGPAGLTAAYELASNGVAGVLLEMDPVVGGLSRTVEQDGYRFDLGGHRFFTKVPEIAELWQQMLRQPLPSRPRLSRIFYEGRFYDYPLRGGNALANLGCVRSAKCALSYLAARLKPIADPRNCEDWLVNQFGKELYRTFFRDYTEKVWGLRCSDISADWAAQRIKSLNLGEALRSALLGNRGHVTSLIERFHYPDLGPGQLWEGCAQSIIEQGWELRLGSRVVGVQIRDHRIASLVIRAGAGEVRELQVSAVISSMPLRELIAAIPTAPSAVTKAAAGLRYRDFITVALILDQPEVFPDNWIYINDGHVRLGRIQNFKNWSPAMVPDRSTTCLGLEYFVQEGDELWRASDAELIAMGAQDLKRLRLDKGRVLRGHVVRVQKAYPVYQVGYQESLGHVKRWLQTVPNLQCVGRNGQHRYNNQDHSMATALIAARNLLRDQRRDPWAVNQDAEYHEMLASAGSCAAV